jgi:hypothetical protein
MPNEAERATRTKQGRIDRYRTHLVALSLLRQKKGEVVVDLAHWMNNHQARLEVAALQGHVADLDRARRQIIVVAVTGIGSVVGAFAFAQIAARAAGASFTTLSWARPIATRASTSLVSSNPLRISLKQLAVGQLANSTLISVPVSVALQKFVGSNALNEVREVFAGAAPSSGRRRWAPVPRPGALSGAQATVAPNETNQHVADLVTRHVSNASTLVQALSLLSRAQRQEWYRALRTQVASWIDQEYGELPSHERAALYSGLIREFLNDLRNDFDALDRQWAEDTKSFVAAIKREQFSIDRIAARRSVRSPAMR